MHSGRVRSDIRIVNTPKEALIIAGVGLAAAGYAGGKILRALSSRKWQPVTGTVVESSVEREVDNDADGKSRRKYKVKVRYSYTAQGRTFTGDRLSFFSRTARFIDHAEAKAHHEAITRGGTIALWHDPTDPAQAVQDRAIPLSWWIVLAFGLVFTLGGALPILLGRVHD